MSDFPDSRRNFPFFFVCESDTRNWTRFCNLRARIHFECLKQQSYWHVMDFSWREKLHNYKLLNFIQNLYGKYQNITMKFSTGTWTVPKELFMFIFNKQFNVLVKFRSRPCHIVHILVIELWHFTYPINISIEEKILQCRRARESIISQ